MPSSNDSFNQVLGHGRGTPTVSASVVYGPADELLVVLDHRTALSSALDHLTGLYEQRPSLAPSWSARETAVSHTITDLLTELCALNADASYHHRIAGAVLGDAVRAFAHEHCAANDIDDIDIITAIRGQVIDACVRHAGT